MTGSLSPTARTTLTRHRERGSEDRADLFAVLAESLVCHVGIVRDGRLLLDARTLTADEVDDVARAVLQARRRSLC